MALRGMAFPCRGGVPYSQQATDRFSHSTVDHLVDLVDLFVMKAASFRLLGIGNHARLPGFLIGFIVRTLRRNEDEVEEKEEDEDEDDDDDDEEDEDRGESDGEVDVNDATGIAVVVGGESSSEVGGSVTVRALASLVGL